MRQLLDTHSFIWFVTGSPRITPEIRLQIENFDSRILLGRQEQTAAIRIDGEMIEVSVMQRRHRN